MKARVILVVVALLLVASALAVEHYTAALPTVRSEDAVTSGSGVDSSGRPVQSPHDFAILEMGMGEVPRSDHTLRYRVRIAEGTPRDIEPVEAGFAQLGPIPKGAEVVVSVVAGGALRGFDEEETVGEARVRIAESLGRQFLVIPVREPSIAVQRHRVEVVDTEEWAVEGAQIRADGIAGEVRTSVLGYAAVDAKATPRVRVVPPPGRTDLLAQEVSLDTKDPMTLVKLASLPARAVEIPELTADPARATIDRVRLQPVDSRNWVREFRVEGGRVANVRPGAYRASWDSGGVRREGLLTVGPEGVRFEDSGRPVRLRQVEVGGAWQAFSTVPMVFVVLREKSESSFLHPGRILGSGTYETLDGMNFATCGRIGRVQDDGSVLFPDVAPGPYEFAILGRPRLASLCIEVPESGDAGVVRRVAHPVAGLGTLYGTVAGPANSKPYNVEIRALGQFNAVQEVKVGETYEFADLSPGVYAVRAIRTDAFSFLRATGEFPTSAWRNVVVDAGLRVKVDFSVK